MNQEARDQWVRTNFNLAMKADGHVQLFIGNAVSELGYILKPQHATAFTDALYIHDTRLLEEQLISWSRINFVSGKFTFRTDQGGSQ